MVIKWRGKEVFSIESRNEPVSNLKNPLEWLKLVFGNASSSGVNVNSENALTLPVYYGGLKVLGEDIAKIPGGTFKKEKGKRTPIDHISSDLIFKKANKYLNSFHWRCTMMIHALTWGNGYSRIIRNGDARPVEFQFYSTNSDVEPYLIDGELWYKIRGLELPVAAVDMFHIRGIGYDGIKGKPLLSVAKEVIGGGLAAQNYTNTNFNNGALKRIALTVPQAATGKGGIEADTAKGIKDDWREATQKGDPSILPFGMTVNDVGLNPSEIDLVNTKKFTIGDYSRFTRIPLHKLAELEHAHYNSLEQQSLDYVIDCLTSWVIQFEMEANDKMLTEAEKKYIYHKFNLNSLVRGDMKTRYESYQSAINTGWLSRNEARLLEDMNPGESLDEYFVPVNMYNPEILDAITKKLTKEANLKDQTNGN